MRVLGLVAVLCVGQAACVPYLDETLKTVGRVELSPEQSNLMHDRIKAVLKDPDSAVFGKASAGVNAAGKVLVCGLVNARNGFGGFTGFKPFSGAFENGSFTVFNLPNLASDVSVQVDICNAQGIPLGA